MGDWPAFGTADTSALRWTRTSREPAVYELRAGERGLGSLRWTHAVGSLAVAESAAGRWTLKRGGFLNPHISVRGGDGAAVARLDVHLRQGLLRTPAGASYLLRRAGLLVPAWQVTDLAGHLLAHIEPVRAGGHLEGGSVEVAEPGRSLPDLPLLLVTAWHFIVLAWFEDEALAASATALDAIS